MNIRGSLLCYVLFFAATGFAEERIPIEGSWVLIGVSDRDDIASVKGMGTPHPFTVTNGQFVEYSTNCIKWGPFSIQKQDGDEVLLVAIPGEALNFKYRVRLDRCFVTFGHPATEQESRKTPVVFVFARLPNSMHELLQEAHIQRLSANENRDRGIIITNDEFGGIQK